jgi:hypothetical protein
VRCIRCGWSKYGFQLTGTPRSSGASPVTYVLRAAQSPTTHQRSLRTLCDCTNSCRQIPGRHGFNSVQSIARKSILVSFLIPT